MPSYKLKYFNSRGLGEVARLLLALKGQEYEDVRFTQETFPKEKPNILLGQLPVLEVDGACISQSNAIWRYLARTFGFYGSNDLEAARIDEVLGVMQDVIMCMMKMYYEKDEARKAQFQQEMKDEQLPKYMGMLQKLLNLNKTGSGFFVGSKITLADVVVYDICDKIKNFVNFDNYAEVKRCSEQVAAEPKIAEWLKKRPVTEN